MDEIGAEANAFPPSVQTSGNQPSWWQQTEDYVVRSASESRFRQTGVTAPGTYTVDQFGRVVQNGQPVTGPGAVANAGTPLWVWLAVAALGAVLVFKLLKG